MYYVVLQLTTTYDNVLQQRTTTYYNVLRRTTTHDNVLQCTTTYYNLLQRTKMYYNILQCTATYCNVLPTHYNARQRITTSHNVLHKVSRVFHEDSRGRFSDVLEYCKFVCACVLIVVFLCTYNRHSSLQRTATCIQRAITYYNVIHHTTACCNVLQRTATYYNVLQRTTREISRGVTRGVPWTTTGRYTRLHEYLPRSTTCYANVLQCTTTYYNVARERFTSYTRVFHEWL